MVPCMIATFIQLRFLRAWDLFKQETGKTERWEIEHKIIYLLLQAWQLAALITFHVQSASFKNPPSDSSANCDRSRALTSTPEVNLLRGQKKKEQKHEIKHKHELIYTWIHVHRAPVPTHDRSSASHSLAGDPGASRWAVFMYGWPCDATAAREAPGRTNKRAKTSVWNSGGVVVYPAARWQLIKHHAQSTAEVKKKQSHRPTEFLFWKGI